MSILGFGRKEGRIFMHIKSALNWLAYNILCPLSCFFTFIVLPLYILGFAFERENLLQFIWPLSSAWPSLLTILLCFACIRGTCAHREYFAWQAVYILLLLFSFCVILFHYAPKAGKSPMPLIVHGSFFGRSIVDAYLKLFVRKIMKNVIFHRRDPTPLAGSNYGRVFPGPGCSSLL